MVNHYGKQMEEEELRTRLNTPTPEVALADVKLYKDKLRYAEAVLARHFWLFNAHDWLVYDDAGLPWLANYIADELEVQFVHYTLTGEPDVLYLPLAEACTQFKIATPAPNQQPHVAKIVYEPIISKEIVND